MKSRPLVPLLDTLDGKKQESFQKCTTVHAYLFRLGGWSVHRWYLYVHDRFYRLVELQLKRERFFVSSLFFCLPNARFVYILYTLVPYFQTLLMHFLILSIPPHYNNNYKKKKILVAAKLQSCYTYFKHLHNRPISQKMKHGEIVFKDK